MGAKLDNDMRGKLKLRVELKLGRVKKTPDPCFIGRSGYKRELCKKIVSIMASYVGVNLQLSKTGWVLS
jgi:hypothetical protein